MKKVLKTALAGMLMLTLGVGLVACGDTADAGSDKVAATVNGEKISESDVQAYIKSYRATDEELSTDEGWAAWLEQAGMTEDELRLQVIDIFAQEEIIRQAAKTEGVTVDDSEIDAQVDVVKSNYADDEAWKSALASAGYTEEEYRDTVGISLLYNALLKKSVTQPTATAKDIQEYLNTNALYYAGKKSSHILFAADDKATAEEVLAKLQSSTDLATDFAAAAAKYSSDSSASNGGNVGWDCLSSFVTEYSKALDALAVGQISGLVESDYGYHIIMCTDEFNPPTDGTTISIASVPEEISEALLSSLDSTLYNTAANDWFTALYEAADIVVYDTEGKPIEEATEETTGTDSSAK